MIDYLAKFKDSYVTIETFPDESMEPTFGEILRKLRKEKQMTQDALAKEAQLSVLSIRRYETGERDPKLRDIKKLADALKISPLFLVTGRRPMLYWSDILNLIFAVDEGTYPINPYLYRDPKLNTIATFLNEAKKKLADGNMTKEGYEKWKSDMMDVFRIPIE